MSVCARAVPRVFATVAVALATCAFAPGGGALSLTVAPAAPEQASLTARNDFFGGFGRVFTVGPAVLNLQAAPAALIRYTFLYQESSFSNRFSSPAGTLDDPPDLYAFRSIAQGASGPLEFAFDSPLGAITNAKNSLAKPNFGVLLAVDLALASVLPAGSTRSALQAAGLLTQYDALLFFNDLGANVDRDFDDMVIGVNINPVPGPSSAALVFAGLLAIAWMTHRRLR